MPDTLFSPSCPTSLSGRHARLVRASQPASDGDGNRYLIEMQKASDATMRKRLVYYACRLVDQMGRHDKEWNYDMVNRVYAVCMMNFTYERNAVLRDDYQLRNADGSRLFSDVMTFIPLQIPCIKAKNAAECKKSYEILLYLLKAIHTGMKTNEELLAEVEGMNLPEHVKETFRRVINTVEDSLTEEQWRDYELDLDKYQRFISEYRTARQEGYEEGHEDGREEGLEEQKRLMAKSMKDNDVSPDIIARCSGLSLEEIAGL